MTTRLIALVMLPVTVMCGLIVSTVVPRWSTAADALRVDRGVVELSALVDLHGAMESQRVLATFVQRIRELGVSRQMAAEVIGIDLGDEAARAASRAERAFDVLGVSSPVDRVAAEELFVDVDNLGWTPPATARFDQMETPIVAALTTQLAIVEDATRRIHADELLSTLDSLRLVDNLIDAAAPQGVDLSALWIPSPTTDQSAASRNLSAQTAVYDKAGTRIRELGVPSIVTAFATIEAEPRIAGFRAAMDRALRGEPVVSPDNQRVAANEVFQGYTLRADLLESLVATATTAVREGAQELAASERLAFVGWAALGTVLTLSSVAVAVACARSISRPLHDLADYAHAVNEGHLDADPAAGATRGPRELRVAGTAFTDLVANLQLLDAKANALASCAFDDPVLNQPLPGRLGSSLESSVAVLSSSIIERDRLQRHLTHQALHDALTGIPNRAAAVSGIQDAVIRAASTGDAMALLFVDLNDFKSVNDRYGHEAGDEVLRQISTRLRDELSGTDLVARLGGDEFVLVAERVVDQDGALELAARVLDIVIRPIDVGAGAVSVGAAVGVVLANDPVSPLDLLAQADAAMYRAKSRGRSAIEVFDADLQRQVVEREDVERALTAALASPDGGGLVLHYQPVVTADGGTVAGVEALIRWDRPGHGFLPPDAFIPIAEATSLIIDLDCWVLAEATRRLQAWSHHPELGQVAIAVNISGRHLQSGRLAPHIAELLGQTGVDPRRLTIEITETVLLDDLVAAAAELQAVRRLGISVAIDDFGTGYTSIAHLQHLPIDTIKIDRSFTSQLNARRGHSLVRMVTDVAHAIGVGIIAEGVETEVELRILRELGADQLQGFLFSRPLPPEAVEDWVQERAALFLPSTP